MNVQVAYLLLTSRLFWGFMYSTQREQLDIWSSNRCGCMFVSSQVDLLLMHPHFLLIVPLYVLLGRCSVILSWAGCLYDPWTEIWLARPECLSFFRFPPSLFPSPPLLRSLLSPLIPLSSPPLLFCMSASPSLLPTQGWNKFKSSPSWHYFFHVKPCVSFKPPPLYFWISGYCFSQVCRVIGLARERLLYSTLVRSICIFLPLRVTLHSALMLVLPHKGACMTVVLEQLKLLQGLMISWLMWSSPPQDGFECQLYFCIESTWMYVLYMCLFSEGGNIEVQSAT